MYIYILLNVFFPPQIWYCYSILGILVVSAMSDWKDQSYLQSFQYQIECEKVLVFAAMNSCGVPCY